MQAYRMLTVLQSDAKRPSLVRTAIPWYPAWRASIDGSPVSLRAVDHAMIGIPAPAGQHRIVLEYSARRFNLGALLTFGTLAALFALAFLKTKTW